jgi:amino acid transporter
MLTGTDNEESMNKGTGNCLAALIAICLMLAAVFFGIMAFEALTDGAMEVAMFGWIIATACFIIAVMIYTSFSRDNNGK